MLVSKRVPLVVCALLIASSAGAQDRPSAASTSSGIASGGWEPLGPVPVDQAGAGRRGYVLPPEGADVTAPDRDLVSLHLVAANNFYREDAGGFAISQRYETHTAALGYRRGFKLGTFPRFELGGQIQLHESDDGVLNGFIQRFEDFWVSVTGRTSAKNQLRGSGASLPPLGTFVTKAGHPLYQSAGGQSGFGDVSFVAKVVLLDGEPGSNDARVAARVGVNVSGTAAFSEGNFAGAGLSLDKKLGEWAAFHGDVRTQLMLDSESQWGLPLKRTSFAFSAGPEFRLASNSSINLQVDGGTTPYLATGAAAFDENYGDITFGVSHRFRAGGRHVLAQLYARENMNLPLRVRWNTDPDLAVGLKATIY